MSYLWDRETLWSLLKHPSEDVQHWAVSRLLDLYPEAETDLLETLPRTSPSLASLILTHVRGRSCPPSLRNFFEHTREQSLKARAAALLIRSGFALPVGQLAAVDLGGGLDLLAQTEPGVAFLLGRYREAAEVDPLLHPMALAGGFADIFLRLEEDQGKKGWRAAIDELGDAWGCDLTELRGLRRGHEAMEALEQTLGATRLAETPDAPWQRELIASMAQDRARLDAIAQAAKGRMSRRSEPSRSEIAFLLSCVIALHRDAVCQRLLLEAREVAALWQGIVLRPWRAEVGPGLADFLGGLDPVVILSSLQAALSHAWAYAAYPFQILNALAIPGRFELFLEVFQEQDDRPVVDEAEEALKAGGLLAVPAILERYRRHLPEPWELFLLEAMPTPSVEEFLAEHFEHYMRHPESEAFVGILESIGSRRFLEPLLAEWRPGELALGRAITLIAAIHGVQDQRIRPIAQEVEEKSRAFKALTERSRGKPGEALRKTLQSGGPFSVPLRCTNCGRTYRYELKKVFVDPKQASEAFIGDIVQCKGCSSIETYELTPASHLALSGEMLRIGLLAVGDRSRRKGERRAQPPETPLIFQKLRFMAAGREFRTMGEAYWFLKGEIDKDPTNGDLHRRLANILKNGGKPDLALPYFLKAIALQPGDAEAYYNIVDILLAQECYREAIPHVRTLVRLCREGTMDDEQRRELFGALLEQVAVLEEKTGQRIELFPTPRPELAREQGPVTVYLTSFDLSNPDDFERMYQLFRTGHLPEAPPKGPLRFLRSALSWGGTAPEDREPPPPPIRQPQRKVGRNAPCPCGSGRKYKACCGR